MSMTASRRGALEKSQKPANMTEARTLLERTLVELFDRFAVVARDADQVRR